MNEVSIARDIAGSAPNPEAVYLAGESGFSLSRLQNAKNVEICALSNGSLYSIRCGDVLVNQVLASPIHGGIHRIYLRNLAPAFPRYQEVVGPNSPSKFTATHDRFCWTGTWNEIRYRCVCRLLDGEKGWFFDLQLSNHGTESTRCDAILVQDLGLASRGHVRNNERFTSQYLDHFTAEHEELGFLVMTRQNLAQSAQHPWLLQGCFPNAVGFCTDGFDFFGSAYKAGGVPAALARSVIGNRIRQYEAGLVALQSGAIAIEPGSTEHLSFFAYFSDDHPTHSSAGDVNPAIIEPLRLACKKSVQVEIDEKTPTNRLPSRTLFQTASLLQAEDLEKADIQRIFGGKFRHVEAIEGEVASAFTREDARHIVMKRKEMGAWRSHGHILRSGRGMLPSDELMSCSFYAPGVFASQMSVGNTVFGKFLSPVRDPLNIIRSSGLRAFVRHRPEGDWQLLGVPSAFEMTPEASRWYYKAGNMLLSVACRAMDDDPVFIYEFEAEGHPVEWLISGEIAAGPHEYDSTPRLCIDERKLRIAIRPDPKEMLGQQMPGIVMHVVSPTPHAIRQLGGAELLGALDQPVPLPYFAIQTHSTNQFSLAFIGTFSGDVQAEALCTKYESFAADSPSRRSQGSEFWSNMRSGFRLRGEKSSPAEVISDAMTWMTHNALIHLSVPRGLEQANGGAWGVRDVCQGPLEFLLSRNQGDIIKRVLSELFSQQYASRHDWPQWFMFPPFERVQASSCHGDIPIWPIKALCDYLQETDDGEFLHFRCPYTDEKTFQRTSRSETILEHVDRVLARIREDFLQGTWLPRYGEGDWDDSLQPSEPGLAQRMTSSWTTALLFQTLQQYGAALEHFGLHARAGAVRELAGNIHADFQRLLIHQGVVAGFGVFGTQARQVDYYMLHPSDERTGLHYRLISITRGILSGILSPEQASEHLELLKKHLLFPDGARLMDRPTKYTGGEEKIFRRSESAAFFGREIGLQYVHAHLRYAEAMAAMGRADDLLDALLIVNPIATCSRVNCARPRQRNAYFSSSDADFRDRFEASEQFERLAKGEIPVEGGWRVYSSGPGIYSNLVVRHLFGLRRSFDWLEFDPVLPRQLWGSTLELPMGSKRVCYEFGRFESGFARALKVNGTAIEVEKISDHPYRIGGIRLRKSVFEAALDRTENRVEIEG